MSGDIFLDTGRLIFDASGAFAKAQTGDELDDAWARVVKPVYGELSEQTRAILERSYSTNLIVINRGMR